MLKLYKGTAKRRNYSIFDPLLILTCQSGVDLGGFFSSDFATEDPKSDSGSQLKDTSLREQIVEFIQKNRVKQEDVAKAISSR